MSSRCATSARRHAHRDRRLLTGPVVGVDDAAGGDPVQHRLRYERARAGGELTTTGAPDHEVEFDFAMVLAPGAGLSRRGDHAMRPDAVADQLDLASRDQSLADEHSVEVGADGEHIVGQRKPLASRRIERHQQHHTRFKHGRARVVVALTQPTGEALTGHALDIDGHRRGVAATIRPVCVAVRTDDAEAHLTRIGARPRQHGDDSGRREKRTYDQDQGEYGARHASMVEPALGYRSQVCARGNAYPDRVSTTSPFVAPVAVARPRRAVIEAAWRAIGPGVEVLSAEDGGPLRRTVKRIIDPLVLRLRSNTAFSAPVPTPDAAVAMHQLIVGHGSQLRYTAAWFAALKAERRRLRLTSGNAQELYFPVCFELAVTKGDPAQHSRQTATAVLGDIHGERDRTAIEVLNKYAEDPHVIAELSAQVDRSWVDVRPDTSITGPFLAGLTTVLGAADGHRAMVARQRVWSALVADAAPYNLGATAHTDGGGLPWSIVDIGLSSTAPQPPPSILGVDSDADRPLNRAVIARVRATLRRAMGRDELPDIPALCAEEVDRACAPWGLLAEDKQATLVAGIEVACELAPLTETAQCRYVLARLIQARLRKEAYVLHARRYLADGGPVHPRQRQVIDELGGFARPYLSRLWARLHGRDVWQESCDDVEDVCALLEGVARSVSLDHRQRIKVMLEQVAG